MRNSKLFVQVDGEVYEAHCFYMCFNRPQTHSKPDLGEKCHPAILLMKAFMGIFMKIPEKIFTLEDFQPLVPSSRNRIG